MTNIAEANVSVAPVRQGISRIRLRPTARITEEDGARTREELLALTGGVRGGVLLEITGVGSVVGKRSMFTARR